MRLIRPVDIFMCVSICEGDYMVLFELELHGTMYNFELTVTHKSQLNTTIDVILIINKENSIHSLLAS